MEQGGERLRERQVHAIEASRSGTIFAYDNKAYQRWLGHVRSAAVMGTSARGLSGAELEQALFAMLQTNSDIVAVRVAAA